MRRRAQKVCAQQGCPVVVARRSRCPAHTTHRHKDPEQAAYYGSAEWKALRAKVRREEPICRICRRARTTSVDHTDGNWRNNARENLRGLCDGCERSRTGRQHNRRAGGVSPNLSGHRPPPAPKSDFTAYESGDHPTWWIA